MRTSAAVWILAVGCVPAAVRSSIEDPLRATERVVARARTETLSTSGDVSREDVLRVAVGRDPGIVARVRRARAMLEEARAETSLPPPELGVQVWNLPLTQPYALGDADMYMVELRQRFLPAGARDARAMARVGEARAELAAASAREQDTRRRVAEVWADYVAGTLHHHVHRDHLQLLGEMLAASRGRFAAGRATLADVTRVEAERARVQRVLTRFQSDRERAARTLNALMDRPADADLGEIAEAPPETVRLALDDLVRLALERRAMVAEARARVRAARAETDAARAEANRPEVSVSLGYWQDPQMRPGVGATAMMSLPWISGGGRAREAAARERESAERAEVEDSERAVRIEVTTALARVRGLEDELGVLRRESRRATERSIEAAHDAYVTGGGDLLMWIDAARMRLDLAMDEADLVADLQRAVAELEWSVGTALPRVALDDL